MTEVAYNAMEARETWEVEKRQAVEQNRSLNWDLYYPGAPVDGDGNKVIHDSQGHLVADESKDKKSKKLTEDAVQQAGEVKAAELAAVQATADAATPDLNAVPEPVEEPEVEEVDADTFDELVAEGLVTDVAEVPDDEEEKK